MKASKKYQNIVFIIITVIIIGILAFTLERGNLNKIKRIELTSNNLLDKDTYLNFAQLNEENKDENLSLGIIRDRLAKHPYVKFVDVTIIERGKAQVEIHEKKMDAILFSNSKQFLITDNSEIIPLIKATNSLNLPVIMYKADKELNVFNYGKENSKILRALNIISTAEIYDKNLYKSISEIYIDKSDNLKLSLINILAQINFGKNEETKKTVYLSKIFNHIKLGKIDQYLKYIDLRYNDMAYLGFDEALTQQKDRIWKRILLRA